MASTAGTTLPVNPLFASCALQARKEKQGGDRKGAGANNNPKYKNKTNEAEGTTHENRQHKNTLSSKLPLPLLSCCSCHAHSLQCCSRDFLHEELQCK